MHRLPTFSSNLGSLKDASTRSTDRPNRLKTHERSARPATASGYLGRIGLFELLVVGDAVREVLVTQPTPDALRAAARKDGMQGLQQEGIVLVAKGITLATRTHTCLEAIAPSWRTDPKSEPIRRKHTMTWLLPLLLFVLFLAVVLCLLTEGLWSNAIRFINVVFAALLATNFWEPTARLLESAMKGGSFWWDLVALWALFSLFVTILQTVTNTISRVNVRFLAIINKAGGITFACLTAAVLVCFANFTLHTAPLAETAFRGGFPSKSSISPDRQWVRFVSLVSGGSMSKFGTPNKFDGGKFNSAYAERRRVLQEQVEADKGFSGSSTGPR